MEYNLTMKYITYFTIYSGDKLPPFYIGSTSLARHKEGYHGTVLSKKYSKIYKQELIEHPELFDSCIIGEFNTREEALACELYYQKLHNVVKSDLFFNMSFAAPNGSFGRDVSGENHPLYGSHNGKNNIHSHNPITGESTFLPYIPEGFIKGRANYKASSHNKGKRWYNNGQTKIMCLPEDCPFGWVPGNLLSSSTKQSIKDSYAKMDKETKDRKAAAVSKAKRGPAYKFYDELYSLWVNEGLPSPNKFRLKAIELKYPDISYHNIIYSKFKVQYENSK